MKYKLIIFLLISIAFSCKKEKGVGTPTQGVLTTGTWYVSELNEDSTDVTYLFDGYTFVFNTNGEVTAACTYGTEVGSWYADDDANGNDEFRIALGNTDPLRHLSKRWSIRSQVVDKVELYEDDNGHCKVTLKKV